MAKASDELRRVLEEILRIRVEAAEDERAIHALEDTHLLPSSQDAQALVAWLRANEIRCWHGWEYISTNVDARDQRALISRLPYIATGVVVLDTDYDRVVELIDSATGEAVGPRLRAPLVIAPTDALRDGLDVLWTVVGPTSDAHFDKTAGARELNQLTEGKIGRQKTIDQHQQWHNALTRLKLDLQKFHDDYPRGWFSEYRQKLEVVESRLDEATRLIARLDSQLLALQSQSEEAAETLQTLKLTRAETTRCRDRLEQFQRTFGAHLEEWKREIVLCRERAANSRRQCDDLRRQANESDAKSRESADQAQAATLRASQFDVEVGKIRHIDVSARQPVAGAIEELRSHYERLLADYEGKVNADALSHMATDRDREAEREEREFQRVLAKVGAVTADEVEVELKQLPAGLSAQQYLEVADGALDDAFRRMGPLKNRLNAIEADYSKAEEECLRLSADGPLPDSSGADSVESHTAMASKAWRERDEHTDLAAAFRNEAEELSGQLTEASHDIERTGKDRLRLESLTANHQPEFDRLTAEGGGAQLPVVPAPIITDNADLVRRIEGLDRTLSHVRARHAALDQQREEVVKEISAWSRQERFGKLRSSISFRFIDRAATAMEANAEFDIQQLDDRVFQISSKLQEADKHREIVIQVLAGAVDEALELLGRISRLSKLPERLPQAGQQFVKIETRASDNPIERRTHIGEFIDEQLEHGDAGDGLQLIQKAVRRVARRITVRVLHPDLHQKTERVSMADMRRFSGGERLTMAILLYCALIRLRRGETNRRSGSSVLILDNPIGTASRVSFLDMQREVARAMNVQLIYATAVKDLNAVAGENVIRLRNTRVDRRTGRHFIEVDASANGESRQVAAARIVFDAAPSSTAEDSERPPRARATGRCTRRLMMLDSLDSEVRTFLRDESRLQRFRDRLRQSQRRAVRLDVVWAAFADSYSDLPSGPERRQWLRAVLQELSQQGQITLPVPHGKQWDRTSAVALPTAITIVPPDGKSANKSDWRAIPRGIPDCTGCLTCVPFPMTRSAFCDASMPVSWPAGSTSPSASSIGRSSSRGTKNGWRIFIGESCSLRPASHWNFWAAKQIRCRSPASTSLRSRSCSSSRMQRHSCWAGKSWQPAPDRPLDASPMGAGSKSSRP